MPSRYLSLLDGLLALGASGFGHAFTERQARWFAAQQQPDGGFAGRRGPSDEYYTDFGARALALLDPDGPALRRAGEWMAGWQGPPHDVTACFGRLNVARLSGVSADADTLSAWLASQDAFTFGGSAYSAFLAALCGEMLGRDTPGPETAGRVLTLRRPGGGFAGIPGETVPQTSATAAALGLLWMRMSLNSETAESACRFLAAMQAPDGGFLAHPDAPESDLLSSFTALFTLCALGEEGRADLPGLVRFLRLLAIPEGGFRAGPSDDGTDVEYGYYGLASLALLRARAAT